MRARKVKGPSKTQVAVSKGLPVYMNRVTSPEGEPDHLNILKRGDNNVKLGYKVTAKVFNGWVILTLTLPERLTCPEDCIHWIDCYGNNMHLAKRYAIDGLTARLAVDIKKWTDYATGKGKRPKGVLVRLHVLGDFYSKEYVEFWQGQLSTYQNLAVFGYTARSLTIKPEIILAIWEMNSIHGQRSMIRMSRNEVSEDSILYAASADQYDGKGFICPVQTGKLDSCADCGLCWYAPNTVIFQTH